MEIRKLKKSEQRKLMVAGAGIVLIVLIICLLTLMVKTIKTKRENAVTGAVFSASGFSDVTNVICVKEKIAVYTDKNGKKGIMLLDGTITEKADEDEIYAVNDEWNSWKIVAKGPRSEYLLCVDPETGTIAKKQYHGPVEPEKTPYWYAPTGAVSWYDPELETTSAKSTEDDDEDKTTKPSRPDEVRMAELGLEPGLYPISDSVKSGGRYGYIDEFLKLRIALNFENALDYSEELAAVKKDGKWGYIDDSGKSVTAFDYDDIGEDGAYCFRNGLAPVSKDGKCGIINRRGEVVVSFNFDTILQGKDGKYIAKKNGNWGVLTINEETFSAENTTTITETGAESASENYRVRTSGSPLNLRAEPDSSANILAKISNGTKINVIKIENGWANVKYNSYIGWVSADYIAEITTAPAESSALN